jgi:hypothetical protein
MGYLLLNYFYIMQWLEFHIFNVVYPSYTAYNFLTFYIVYLQKIVKYFYNTVVQLRGAKHI